ncbi:uncharacterized protein LOC128721873 [Anopheles nili]|uniref:uncharacterized protein LOC128721873 n=1 Tax=Anopheles nili TaxID=185578 RepID=UPI00237C4B9E|nr:uncharacterized protein LOC128721873 [Anopheles nili]
MPQTTDELEDDGSKNMVSNLPLLFADGYPTTLDKITEPQLEKFIPFMVQCSLGYIHIHSIDEFKKPEWWPSDVEFTKPFRKPKSFTGNWLQKMRELVVVCYSFHRSVYLLRYCTDLASFQTTALRFINNYNSTTSLFERSTNKLLVTFRNENMLYDQEQKINSRKCLLPKQSNSQSCMAAQEEMVISAGFDIYLCDNCDGELYSYGALVEHEKVCLSEQGNAELEEISDDDDVIFCGEIFEEQLPLGSIARARAEQQKMISFLSQNFMLRCTKATEPATGSVADSSSKSNNNIAELESVMGDSSPMGKLRRIPRRARQVVTLAKCTQIPLASPLGQFMLRSTKTTMTSEHLFERLDRMERFCLAPPLPPGTGHLFRQGTLSGSVHDVISAQDRRLPKWLTSKPKSGSGSSGVPLTFKRNVDETYEPSNHQYKFPRRQFSTKHRMENFLFYNKLLLKRCLPCAVVMKRLTPAEVEELSLLPGIERQKREAEQAAIFERQRRKELAESAMIIDSINLCSSDDESSQEPVRLHMVDTGSSENNTSSIDYYIRNVVQPIEVEMEDAESLSSDTNASAPSLSVHSLSQIKPSYVCIPLATPPGQPRSPIIASLLSESTFRLNHSVLVGHGNGRGLEGALQPLAAPMYLNANCSQTPVGVPGDGQIANGNRLVSKKGTANVLLKENLLNGFGTDTSDDTSPLGVVGSQGSAPPRTLVLAAPISNGQTLIGTIPVSFGSGGGIHARSSASVVQSLTTATYVNQTVHTRVTVNRTTGPAAAVLPSSATANLQ